MSISPDKTLDLLWALRDLDDDRLSPTHRLVLLVLPLFRQKDGTIRPSVSQIAKASGLHRNSVQRAIHELERFGVLAIRPRRTGSRDATHDYAINVAEGAGTTLGRAPESEGPSGGAPLTVVPGGPSGGAQGGPSVVHSEDLGEDLGEDPSGGPPPPAPPPSGEVLRLEIVETAKPRTRAPKGAPKKPAGNAPGVNDVLGAFRAAFKAKHGTDPDGLTASAAGRLLKAVSGRVDDACERVRRGIAAGATELHHIANQPNRYGAATSATPARKGDVRGIAQDGVSTGVELQGFG